MNIDGHKFNFPEKPKKLIPPIEKIYPPQNPPQDEGEKEKKSSEKSPEEKRTEKNQLEDKGNNLDITI